jgi:hypothetical protein
MLSKNKTNGDKKINHNNIKAILGLTDKSNHSVFYLEGGAFITPMVEYDNFNEIIKEIQNSCKYSIKKKLLSNSILSNDFIMNFEVCSDRMKINKPTYLSFQYHFRQKDDIINILKLKSDYEPFFIDILNNINDKIESYSIKVSKKKN